MPDEIKLGLNYALINIVRYGEKAVTKEGKTYYRFPYWFEQLPGTFEFILHVEAPEDLKEFIAKAGLGNPNPQIQKPNL